MKLVTLGCSWTYGIGVMYQEGDTKEDYEKYRADREGCYKYSFRGLLAEKYGWSHQNLSRGGSSNDKQFRRATEYFQEKPIEQTIVLWGITSTARTEVYSVREKKLRHWNYNSYYKDPKRFSLEKFTRTITPELYAQNFYDHDNEVKILTDRMLHWNLFFESLGITNYWFDTFNTHEYTQPIPRLLKGDLLSRLVESSDKDYHYNNWDPNDSRRIMKAQQLGIVNSHSQHPTQKGHRLISEIFVENFFSKGGF
tara:strand:- start:40 stop:798 length:759 start_codon:yes stop_codon:yes gene_type:complete